MARRNKVATGMSAADFWATFPAGPTRENQEARLAEYDAALKRIDAEIDLAKLRPYPTESE